MVGLSQPMVSMIKNCKREPSVKAYRRLEEAERKAGLRKEIIPPDWSPLSVIRLLINANDHDEDQVGLEIGLTGDHVKAILQSSRGLSDIEKDRLINYAKRSGFIWDPPRKTNNILMTKTGRGAYGTKNERLIKALHDIKLIIDDVLKDIE